MERYEKYMDSGVKWIGEIPEGWEVKKLKYGVTVNPSKDDIDKTSSELVVFLPMEKVTEDGEIDCSIKKSISDLYNGFTCFRKNDVIVAKITPCFENGKGAFLNKLETELGFGSTEFHVLRVQADVCDLFLYYVTKSEIFMKVGEAFMSGAAGQKRVPTDFITDFPLVKPSKTEQTAIANYLDCKTAEIDQLIAQKERLLDLYEEEKAAIINQAVTKGINPNVKLKNSGIDWLGEIPEVWKIVSLKWVSRIYSGGTPDKNNINYWFNGTIPWLNSGTVNQFIITEPSEYITEYGFQNSSAKWIDENSIVIALAGQGKTKGMAALITFKTTCNQSLGIIKPNTKIKSKYLLYYLRKNYQNIRSLAGEGKRDGLNLEMIGSIHIPLFDRDEQTDIVCYIEKQATRINTKITKTKKIITLQKEYRTALISEVVTGKIKVTSLTSGEITL